MMQLRRLPVWWLTVLCISATLAFPAQAEDSAWPWRKSRLVSSNVLHASDADLVVAGSVVDTQGRVYVSGTIIRAQPVNSNEPVNPNNLVRMTPAASFTAGGGGGDDIFIARISAGGDAVEFIAQLGGSGRDGVSGMMLDSQGRVLVVGSTESVDFPWAAAHREFGPMGGADVFVLMLDANGTSLLSSARVGGQNADQPSAIRVAPDGGILVAGSTMSSSMPTTQGALQRTYRGKWDGFVMKFAANLEHLHWSTLIGGPTDDQVSSIDVTSSGDVIVVGNAGDYNRVDPELPVTPASFGPHYQGRADAFVLKLDASGSSVEWGGYLGGDEPESARTVRIAHDGTVIVVGSTWTRRILAPHIPEPVYFPQVPAPQPFSIPVNAWGYSVFLTAITADGRSLRFSRIPDITASSVLDLAIAPDGSLGILVSPDPLRFDPFADLSTDLISNPDSFPWRGWTAAVVFNQDASAIRFNTRSFPASHTTLRSLSFLPDGRMVLASNTNEANVPLGPVTGTAARLDSTASLASVYVATLRLDADTRCAPELHGLPPRLNPFGGEFQFEVRTEPGCPWNMLSDRLYPQDIRPGFTVSPGAGTASATVTARYDAHNSRHATDRTLAGSMTVRSVRQFGIDCPISASFPTTVLAFPASGGLQEIRVTTGIRCELSAEAAAAWPSSHWFSVAQQDLSESELQVAVAVPPNPGLSRLGSLRVGNNSIPVMQATAGGCTVGFPGGVVEAGHLGGTLQVPFTLDGPSCAWTLVSADNWVTVAGASTGTGSAGSVQVQVQPFTSQSFRQATLFVNGQPLTIRQAGFDIALPPEISSVTDAAAYRPERLASGGLATLFGLNLSGPPAHAAAQPLPLRLGDVTLRIRLADGRELAAPLLYVSPSQINFQIPEDAAGEVQFRVEHGQRISAWFAAAVQPFFPSLFRIFQFDGRPFTFAGYAHLVLPDGTVDLRPLSVFEFGRAWFNGVSRGPEGSELYIVLFGTGFPKDATLEDYGGPSWNSRFRVTFAGPHSVYAGVQQINIHIPRDVEIPVSDALGHVWFDLSIRGIVTDSLPIGFRHIDRPW